MKRRAWFVLLALVAGGFVILIMLARRPRHDLMPAPVIAASPRADRPSQNPPSIITTDSLSESALDRTVSPLKPALAKMPASGYTPEQKGRAVHAEALQDIERVQGMLRDFRTAFGGNPVGTNAEIMAALNGANAKQARLGPPDGEGLNQEGELVDRWGTPYFFHQIDAHHMEVHSAGEDKKLGTADDVVMR